MNVLPSETARLVYGYLQDEGLKEIAKRFLETSEQLPEYRRLLQQGQPLYFNETLSLQEIVSQYYSIKSCVKRKIGSLPKTSTLYGRLKLQCETVYDKVFTILSWNQDPTLTNERQNSSQSCYQETNQDTGVQHVKTKQADKHSHNQPTKTCGQLCQKLSQTIQAPIHSQESDKLAPELCQVAQQDEGEKNVQETSPVRQHVETNQVVVYVEESTQISQHDVEVDHVQESTQNVEESMPDTQHVNWMDPPLEESPEKTQHVSEKCKHESFEITKIAQTRQDTLHNVESDHSMEMCANDIRIVHIEMEEENGVSENHSMFPIQGKPTIYIDPPEDGSVCLNPSSDQIFFIPIDKYNSLSDPPECTISEHLSVSPGEANILPLGSVVQIRAEEEIASMSPNRRGLGIDKLSFLKNMELTQEGREEARCEGENMVFTSPDHADRKKVRKGYPTPNKSKPLVEQLVPEDAIKASLPALFENNELHEKLAQNINETLESVGEREDMGELDYAIQSIIDKTECDPLFDDILNTTLKMHHLHMFLKPSGNIGPNTCTSWASPPSTTPPPQLDTPAEESSIKRRLRSAKKNVDGTLGTPVASTPVRMVEVAPRSSRKSENNLKDTSFTAMASPCGTDSFARCSSVDNFIITEHSTSIPSLATLPCSLPSLPVVQPFPSVMSVVTIQQGTLSSAASKRFRDIKPKPRRGLGEGKIEPIIVLQPIVQGPLTALKKTKKDRKIAPAKTKKSARKKPTPSESETQVVQLQPEQTEESGDMPNIFPTPARPTREAAIVPEETPDVRTAPLRRLSLSSPRHKSHVRALDFETPQKALSETKRPQPSESEKLNDTVNGRNLFASPAFKSPLPKSVTKKLPVHVQDMSIPIATRSPRTTILSEAWGDLTGVDCVLGKSSRDWDTELRSFVGQPPKEIKESKPPPKPPKAKEKKPKKPDAGKKPEVKPPKTPCPISPSKLSLTSKRNTYSISKHDLSPVLSLETPLKSVEPSEVTNDTPVTKLLRENVERLDVDISMLVTPDFPATPFIRTTADLVTPIHDHRLTDYSSGSSYYRPDITSPLTCFASTGDETIRNLEESEAHLVDVSTSSGTNYVRSPKKDEPQMVKLNDSGVEKSSEKNNNLNKIRDLLEDAKKVVGLKDRQAGGKIMSMIKLQMIVECDKKLCENIPLHNDRPLDLTKSTVSAHSVLQMQLNDKKHRTLNKLKNDSETSLKRRRYSSSSKRPPAKRAKVNEEQKPAIIVHSTPCGSGKTPTHFNSSEETNNSSIPEWVVDDIRQDFPSFEESSLVEFSDVNEEIRKKIHFIGCFLEREEIIRYLDVYVSETRPPKLRLKPSMQFFFKYAYMWLKKNHRQDAGYSEGTRAVFKKYFYSFEKLAARLKKQKKQKTRKRSSSPGKTNLDILYKNYIADKTRSSEDEESIDSKIGEKWTNLSIRRRRESNRRGGSKDAEAVESFLPLKKRTASKTANHNLKSSPSQVAEDRKRLLVTEGAASLSATTPTQSILQHIDVDRFLSQIHSQETS